jgi:hypothetical protein
MGKPNVKIITAANDEPAPAEIIERAIIDLAAGMKALDSSRLKRETIVTLLHASSGVGKPHIRLILNNLADLESTFLRPKLPGVKPR